MSASDVLRTRSGLKAKDLIGLLFSRCRQRQQHAAV